jgi:hypothetical protein
MIPKELVQEYDRAEEAKKNAENDFRKVKYEILEFCLMNKLFHCLDLRSTWRRDIRRSSR